MKLIDLTGQRFGRLIVLERAEDHILPSGQRQVMWKCKCSCGNECTVSRGNLRNGNIKSCGCYSREMSAERLKKKIATTHGKRYTRLYEIWCGIKKRCHNPNSKAYRIYGAEGKTVCEEWQEFQPFYDWAMANGYSDNLTIERIDVTKGYSPENCKFATAKEQANNKRNNHLETYKGKTKTIAQLAEEYGLSESLLRWRLKNGWNLERAIIEKPYKGKNQYGKKTS